MIVLTHGKHSLELRERWHSEILDANEDDR
jgi:hypothetical protein